MRETDEIIIQRLQDREEEFGRATYTRYADDITVSVENKRCSGKVLALLREAIEKGKRPNFNLNGDKTKLGSKPAGTSFVTGIRICKDGRLTLHRSYKSHVRLLTRLYEKGKLNKEEIPSLKGHLNYCASVDPKFFNKIACKHFLAVKNLELSTGISGTTEEPLDQVEPDERANSPE